MILPIARDLRDLVPVWFRNTRTSSAAALC